MRFFRTGILILVALLLGGGLAFGATATAGHDVQMDVLEVAVIALNNTTLVTLTTIGGVAGADPTGSSDALKELRYTSLAGGSTRQIQANYGATDVTPGGILLNLEATAGVAGCGTLVGGGVDLTAAAVAIITNISSCATGIAAGAELTYTLVVDDVLSLVVGDTQTVTVTLTLTEDTF